MDGPEAFEQSKILWRFLIESLPIPMEAILIFFSGNRGIHFYVDMRVIGSEPSELFFRYLKMFCSRLATDAGVVIDMAVYGPLQVVRSPNAKHAGSGLYKICLSPTELQEMRREEILEIAQQPRYFDLSMQTINVLPELTKRWSEGVETVDRAENERKSRVMIDSTASSNMFSPMMSSGSTSNHPFLSYPSLHSQTLDFIKLGAPVGTRHSRLVAATKNFADFGPGAKGLAYALLYPAAFMSGLPNDEICKVLEWAFK